MKHFIFFVIAFVSLSSCSGKTSSREQGLTSFYRQLYLDFIDAGLSKKEAAAIIQYAKDNEGVEAPKPESNSLRLVDSATARNNAFDHLVDALKSVKMTDSVFKKSLANFATRLMKIYHEEDDHVAFAMIRALYASDFEGVKIKGMTPQEEAHNVKMGEILGEVDLLNNPDRFTSFIEQMAVALDAYKALDKSSEVLSEVVSAATKLKVLVNENEIEEKLVQKIEETTGESSPVASLSGTEFLEAGANNGSISTTLNITLTQGAFSKTGVLTKDAEYDVTGVPAGLTLVVNVSSSTQATLSFTGNATAHAHANDASMTLTLKPVVFTSFTWLPSNPTFTINFADPSSSGATLAYSGTSFNEAAANDGSVAGSVTITLTNDTFSQASGTFTADTHYTLSGTAVPAGLTAVITVTDSTHATLTFTGNAASHEAANNVTGMTLTFNDDAFTGGEAPDDGTEDNDFAINFSNSPSIAYSATTFLEAGANNGSVATSVTMTLTGDTFSQASGTFTANTHYTLSGDAVPAGLTAVVTVVDSTHATLTFTGNASPHAAAQSLSGLTLTWEAAAFTTTDGPIDGTEEQDFAMTFYDTRTLMYSGTTFTEATSNAGAIATTVTITAGGTTFSQASGTFTANTHYTLSGTGVPAGLTAVVTVTDSTHATLTFTGSAAAHAAADSVTGIVVTFESAAFTGGLGPSDGSEVEDFAINYYNQASLAYNNLDLEEGGLNNGHIGTTVAITLSGNTYSITSGALTLNTHFTLSGTALPAGLTATLSVDTSTSASLYITGNAVSHQAGDSVSGIVLTLLPAAFTNNVAPVDGTEDASFSITFITSPHLDYSSSTFDEAGANDGSISAGVNMTLEEDTFSIGGGTFTENTHYTLTGTAIPAGLTAEVQWLSSTTARIVLIGNAAAHLPADNVSGITITWLAAAFTNGVIPTDGSEENDFAINFINPGIMLFEAGNMNGNLGGRAGADALCLAAQPVESSHANVKAFISVDGADEIQDLPTNYSIPTGVAIRSKLGTVIADNWADLLDGDLADDLISAGIISTASFWWSGSDTAGALGSDNCSGWTSAAGMGDSGSTSSTMSDWLSATPSMCNDVVNTALLCVAFD